MGKHTGRNVGILIGAVILIAAVMYYGDIDLKDLADTSGGSGIGTGQTPSQTAATGTYQVYGGNYNLQTQTKDSLDVTITYGDDTELDTICWDAKGSDDERDWIQMPGGSMSEAETGDANIDFDTGSVNANGIVTDTGDLEMWCEFNLESAQDFFVDQAKIIQVNDDIDTCIWVDANDDNDETWACRLDISKATNGIADPQNEPFNTIQVYLFDEDTDGTIMDTGVASATSVAQSDVSTELLTHLDIASASADVVVITDIRLRNNLTSATDGIWGDNTELCFEDSTAKAVWYDTREEVGCLEFSDDDLFDFDQGASTQEWIWSVDGYNEGILIMVPKNEGLQVDTPLKINTKFTAATDAICVELAYKYIDAFENKASFDAVDIEVTAASSAGDECTIS